MIINTEIALTLSNENGAIIIGKNSCGKSTILKRINNAGKRNNRLKSDNVKYNDKCIEIDGTSYNIRYFDSDWSNKKNFDGAFSTIAKTLRQTKDEIIKEINPSENIFNSENWNEYKNIFQEKVSIYNKKNIFGSGIDFEYKNNINLNELISLDAIIVLEGVSYNLNEVSSGVKQIISQMLSSIESEKENKKPEIILLDEPETFLHPTWYKLLVNLINKSIEKKNKVILTTHNPYFLSLLLKNEENIKMLSCVEPGETENNGILKTINFDRIIKDINIHQKMLNGVEENIEITKIKFINFMTPQICEGMYSDDLIVVEGITDLYYLRNKFPNKTILSTYGYHQFYFLARLFKELKMYPKFIIDTDVDKNNNIKDKNKFVYELLEKNRNRIHRMKKDLENYLYNESIKDRNQKMDKILNFLAYNEIPVDPDKEQIELEYFINS